MPNLHKNADCSCPAQSNPKTKVTPPTGGQMCYKNRNEVKETEIEMSVKYIPKASNLAHLTIARAGSSTLKSHGFLNAL
jgi:hypothetical protein